MESEKGCVSVSPTGVKIDKKNRKEKKEIEWTCVLANQSYKGKEAEIHHNLAKTGDGYLEKE